MGASGPGETTSGERLLRSDEVARASVEIEREVEAQVGAALQGPLASAALISPLPRTFVAVGAALTLAYGAVGAGDEARAAGALRCAQGYLFPADPLGHAAFAGVTRPILDGLAHTGEPSAPIAAQTAAQMERHVGAEVERLERAFASAELRLAAAALGAYSWTMAAGGAGPQSGVSTGHLAPFLSGLTRWAFYTEAALDAIGRDDWARVGAALIAARKVTAGS